MFYPFFDNSLINKDINFIQTDPVFNLKETDLYAGPKKQPFMGYLLYIAKGDRDILGEMDNAIELDSDIESEEDILENSSFNDSPEEPEDMDPKGILQV